MNWGYKILIVYLVFVAGILLMVFKSSMQKVDLVTNDYYNEELKYQHKIDQNKNTTFLSEAVKYEYRNNQLDIQFPKDFSGKKINGMLTLYYPANDAKDISFPFSTTTDSVSIKIPAGSTGLHEIHLNWEVDGVKYNYEKKIFL